MFDVGFSEMLVIAIVALVVIGPEKLPRVARTAGAMLGRLQRYVNDVKADINREIELEDLKKFKTQFEDAAGSVEAGIREEMQRAESTVNSIGGAISDPLAAAATATSEALASTASLAVAAPAAEGGAAVDASGVPTGAPAPEPSAATAALPEQPAGPAVAAAPRPSTPAA